MDPVTSSPTNSSLSSSDFDTESTGSFFPDRSTTLGTLIGVSLPDGSASFRLNGEQRRTAAERRKWRWRRRGGSRWWTSFCCESSPTSLGDFLQVERSLYGAGGDRNSGRLFENGLVLPPVMVSTAPEMGGRLRRRLVEGRLARLPVLFTGICCACRG
ncbi:hypothetical protein LUZ60_003149 [Juncus effusus]|nr:hypothetical protein LUZ60_003149 [Juncus effusus]